MKNQHILPHRVGGCLGRFFKSGCKVSPPEYWKVNVGAEAGLGLASRVKRVQRMAELSVTSPPLQPVA